MQVFGKKETNVPAKHARTTHPQGHQGAHRVRLVVNALLFVLAAAASFAALEIASNPKCYLIPPLSIAFCIVVLALFLTCLYFLGQQHKVVPMLGVAAVTALGIIEYFVLQFKGAPILPGDVLVAGTALDVAGEYEFSLPTSGFVSLFCGVAGIVLLAFVKPRKRTGKRRARRVASNVGTGAVCAIAVCALVVGAASTNFLGVGINYFSADKAYREHGFIPTFIRAANDIRMVAPEGYTQQAAEELEIALAAEYDEQMQGDTAQIQANEQFERIRPSVVIVMNESYSDLSLFEQLHSGYAGTWLTTNKISGALRQGWLAVPVIGGGTADVEFEALTGISLGILGSGKHPYPQYNFDATENLARYFKGLGYHTSAMHPASGSNYRRESVYPQMGFDDTYFTEDFPNAQHWHGWIDDGDTYDKILAILEDESTPQFVFDVTVQNHGGYDKGNIPDSKPGGYTADWLEEEDNAKMNDFLACIERSDMYLQRFLEQLSQLDRPVAVLFFGDHQPRMAEYFNDDLFENEDELEHFARITKVPYLIWANYEVSGRTQVHEDMATAGIANNAELTDADCLEEKQEREGNDFKEGAVPDTCSTYLGPVFLQHIGVPLTDYHKALQVISADVATIGASSYRGGDGKLYSYDTQSPYENRITQLSYLQFYEFP